SPKFTRLWRAMARGVCEYKKWRRISRIGWKAFERQAFIFHRVSAVKNKSDLIFPQTRFLRDKPKWTMGDFSSFVVLFAHLPAPLP
ncbi:MAG TPA: hypothetical protein PL074_04815, partial [Thermoflexales bacterium]|nr:hypothetical protein [Thermoflexales bacterium]